MANRWTYKQTPKKYHIRACFSFCVSLTLSLSLSRRARFISCRPSPPTPTNTAKSARTTIEFLHIRFPAFFFWHISQLSFSSSLHCFIQNWSVSYLSTTRTPHNTQSTKRAIRTLYFYTPKTLAFTTKHNPALSYSSFFPFLSLAPAPASVTTSTTTTAAAAVRVCSFCWPYYSAAAAATAAVPVCCSC
jgi:hypothetical protein